MKNLLITLTAIILLITSCKKSHITTVPAKKIFLLQKASYLINGNSFTDRYEYDDKNRVVFFYTGLSYCIYKYTYNNDNQVATVAKYEEDGTTLADTNSYTYSGNTVTIKYKSGGTCTLVLGTGLEVTSSCQPDKFTFDSNGNITKDNVGSSQRNYLYDKKNNPLSMMGGSNLHMMYFALEYAQTFKNNITSINDTYDSSNNAVYSYQYNAEGFPVNATVTSNSGVYTINYTYIIK